MGQGGGLSVCKGQEAGESRARTGNREGKGLVAIKRKETAGSGRGHATVALHTPPGSLERLSEEDDRSREEGDNEPKVQEF